MKGASSSLPLLRRLPRSVAPLLDETLYSYLSRLADAHQLDAASLRTHVAGGASKSFPITAERLGVLTGHRPDVLRYAILELCSSEDLRAMRVKGRVRPHRLQRAACRLCAAGRGVYRPVTLWTTHDDVICHRHRKWIGGGLSHDQQPDLVNQPDILRAHRRHRHLIRRYGRERVRTAISDATMICEEWRDRDRLDDSFNRRMVTFYGRGWRTDQDDPTIDAATYPEIVALARMLASPHWHHQAIKDNLISRAARRAAIDQAHEALRASWGDLENLPDDVWFAASGLLRSGPALASFIEEVQRTVEPNFQWSPYKHHRRFDPLTQWIMDEISLLQDPGSHVYRLSRRPTPSEMFGVP